MENNFYNTIANSTAHRPIRDVISGEVFANPELFPILLKIALDVNDKNHHKACWSLELVLESKIEWLTEYLDVFCNTLQQYTHQGALRSVSKICLFVIGNELKVRKSGGRFTESKHNEQITTACFDWLIYPDGKVAIKVYAMRTLYLLSKYNEWILPDLTRILSDDASKHTAAYISAAKDILKKIKHTDN
jgi:hypothetical protein